MEAGKRNLPGVFNRSTLLKIPHFQRSYVWNEEQWARFLDDMKYVSRTNRPYFMGSVILKQQETTTESQTRDVRTVVDGQQRLTTILLFFKVLYEKLKLQSNFSTTFKTFNDEVILEHNYLDKPVFDKIVLEKEEDLTETDKEKAIYKCFDYFRKNVKDDIKPNSLLQNVMFVGIDLQSTEDEQQIFDTINSLGVSLTTAELLKNHLFKDDESYDKNWRQTFEKDDDTRNYWDQDVTSGRQQRTNIDLFLQSYLFIKVQEKALNVASDDKERFSRVDSIFSSYKELMKTYGVTKDVVVKELKEYAAIYRQNIDPRISEKDIEKGNFIQRLNLLMFGLGTSTIIPYVLYVLRKIKDDSERSNIFRYLEAYLMRRIICRATTKNYNQLFGISLINNEIDSLSKLKDLIELKSEKINYMPANDDVEKSFNESILPNPQALAVLYLMEKTIRSDLYSTELKPFDEYSLEHVLPRKWRNNWEKESKLDEGQAKERDRILSTLGNLTMITGKLNSSIRDSDWATKKTGSGKNQGLNEYAQGIEIFSRYLQRDRWSEDTIRERGKELSSHAIQVWSQQ